MDAATTTLCVKFVQQFRNGLSQALLYTEGTKQFERACNVTYAALDALLQAIGNFKFGILKNELLINGERIDTPANVRAHLDHIEKTMSAAGTSSLKFDKALEEAEVGPFLQALARKKIPAESSRINDFLREQGITHLQIDELRYVALSDEQKVYTGDGPVPGTHAVAQKALSELVDWLDG